jgi:hypothetical protein
MPAFSMGAADAPTSNAAIGAVTNAPKLSRRPRFASHGITLPDSLLLLRIRLFRDLPRRRIGANADGDR